MSDFARSTTKTVIPGLRYRDALRMIAWLEQAFGFRRHAVYMADETAIAHAELAFGQGMIMLGSIENQSALAALYVEPSAIGNRVMQGTSLITADCAALYQSAQAAGAEMVLPLREMEYGGKAFTCRDPEGHLWSVGEYDPWAVSPA